MAMTELDEVNASLKRTNIKGKAYIDVAQRIQAFRKLYPHGAIITEKLSDDGSRCDFIARIEVFDEQIQEWVILSTGHAFEFQSASNVNKTSYVENCETSAVGRALGFLGIGSTESLCSADEVQAAIEHQERNEQPSRVKSDPLTLAQKRITEIARRRGELEGITAIEWYEQNVKVRSDYSNDAETLNRISDELEEVYGN